MNRKILQIVVPILIILVIIGIWAYKNTDAEKTGSLAENSSAEGFTEEEKTDFALDAAFFDLEKLKSYGMPIIIDFGADWCGPCREFKPILDTAHEEMLGKAIIKYVDVDKYPDIAGQFPISVIPTQVFISSDGTPYVPGQDTKVQFTTFNDKDSGEPAFTIHEGGLTSEQLQSILKDMGVTE